MELELEKYDSFALARDLLGEVKKNIKPPFHSEVQHLMWVDAS